MQENIKLSLILKKKNLPLTQVSIMYVLNS